MSTSSLPSQRTLHLVDLENLVGGARANPRTVLEVFDRYLEVADWRDGDQVSIAMNPLLACEVMYDLPVPHRLHTAIGENGADLALLAHDDPRHMVRRFARLVVGSGDGIFAPLVREVKARGTDVLVVCRVDSWSNAFLGLTRRYIDLPAARRAA